MVVLSRQEAELTSALETVRNQRDDLLPELVNAALGMTYEAHQLEEGTHACPDPDEEQNLKRRRQGWPKDPTARAFFEQMEAEAAIKRAQQVPSPTGRCVYLDGDDNECVFCGHPDERK